VRFPGWLPRADVEGLWRAATAHVFASFYVGFGLPVLEAMARGVPGACSDRASMPEVAGDAALLFDPNDSVAIRAAIERLLGDAGLREQLSTAGLERAAQFSWERCARETAAAYERALA
jgi:glycosyltransferase involved in cell wall biosynthesis